MGSPAIPLLTPEWVDARFHALQVQPSIAYFYFPLPAGGDTVRYLRTLLTEDETARAARYIRLEDRERSVASRGALRHLLGAGVKLVQTPLGRPVLAEGGVGEFNVSHSGAHLLIGMNPQGRVGVDVEESRPGDSEFLLTTMTDRERRMDGRLDAADRHWFRHLLWTRKEAASKAVGLGLHQDPATLDVLDETVAGLRLHSFALGTAAAAIADEGPGPRQFFRVKW
ncbi:MAG TPA: 4'-phosphopantetheinyl transferase superfamily protein [Candidatus Sulfopaludibacter sp.]|jgi:phosphopantetheinyl transferase|nr:4'-phosphopantetheinyl transferase superfamily protein [Candidatus Sulfopaludibacter sp.]